MNVFVTGGSGFVGRHCVSALRNSGHHVVAPTSQEVDITTFFKINHHFDCVVHLAAYNITSVGDKNADVYTQVNVEGTKNVLRGVPGDQFIFLSTAKIYEDTTSLYVQSKVAAEDVCQQYTKGKTLTIIRSANILGQGQALKAVLPVFIERAKRNAPIEIMGNPQTAIAYLDVRDVATLIVRIVEKKNMSGIYNAAYSETVTLHELALKVIAACQSSSKIVQKDTRNVVNSVRIDCQKTADDFNFKPQYNIDQIIESVIS